MANDHRYLGLGLSAAFGVAALLFFGMAYPHHLHHQEECQLFLFTRGYFFETVSCPGGSADYIGRFLTQFYYHAWAGAAILAVLLVVVQRLVWALAKRARLRWAFYPISFVPSIALWASYCDADRMLSLFIACALSLLAARLYLCFGNTVCRLALAAVMMPVLYWTVGSAYFTFVGLVVLFEGLHAAKEGNWLQWIAILGVGCGLALFYPWMARGWAHYPLGRLVVGLNYHRAILKGLSLQFAVIILAAFVPVVFRFLPDLRRRSVLYLVVTLELIVLVAGGYYVVWRNADMAAEEVFAYEYYARTADWARIVEIADRKPPTTLTSIVCLNLALAKTGQLGDKMFAYYQAGRNGLFGGPEVCYHLGMINAAQRFPFDMMEFAGDFQKSARHVKRLAEINIINGQYQVAARYVRLLQRTLFYRSWANETMALLNAEDRERAINEHPEYGGLREIREQTDDLWPYHPKFEKMQEGLQRLVHISNKNRMAYEYLLASALVDRKLDRFLQFYSLGKDLGYDRIPTAYQEALSYAWLQQHSSFEGLPWPIEGTVLQRLQRFLVAVGRRHPADQLHGSFGTTYWYYLWFYSPQ